MKILGPQQIKQCDEFAIRQLPISSIDLMEKAALASVDFIKRHYLKSEKVFVFCGKGNNGGDGLAISRLLLLQGYQVHTYIVEHSEKSSTDLDENLKRFAGPVLFIKKIEDLNFSSAPNSLIIDAIIGNGIKKPLDGIAEQVVNLLNQIECHKLAIDISTGLFAEMPNSPSDVIFRAHKTLTFQAPKLNFMFKENFPFVGDFRILEIGWPQNADRAMESNYHFTTSAEVSKLSIEREKFNSKHNFGHALIIAGSYGKIGAALLASRACLRTGAGLTTTYSPKCGYYILQSQAPEVMCVSDPETEFISALPELKYYNAVAIGPGIGLELSTQKVVGQLLQQCDSPMVIDADAINVIAANKQMLKDLKPGTILTPHNKEFERLSKKCETDFERLQIAIDFAKEYKIILVLKGAHTAVIDGNGKVYFNSTGNPALAKGGSGDMLTGMIVAKLAKGHKPLDAAILSVFHHGQASDICAKKQNMEAITASDLIEALNFIA